MTDTSFVEKYGPTALVTGASSGIGRSFAYALAAKGMDLVLLARRVDRLEEIKAELEASHGIKVRILSTDLADLTAGEQILAQTADLDIGLIISNAGIGIKGDLTTHDPKFLSDILIVNSHTPLQLSRGYLPRLRARGKGGIILVSSVEALVGMPYSATYSGSKAFVNNLGEGLWGETSGEDIDILVMCPGATDTEALRLQGVDPSKLQNLQSPDDVAKLTLDNITNGPVFIPNDHYKMSFERLAAMPRRDALLAMAGSMKK